MNNLEKRELEIIQEVANLLSIERKATGKDSLIDFIDIYLPALKTAKSPLFHKEMLQLIQQTIRATEGNLKQRESGAGGEHPLGVVNDNAVVPPYSDQEIPNESAQLEESSSPNFSANNLLNRLLFIAPRGFAKSTLCSVFFPLWLACYGYKKDIFIVSATISLSQELLRKIRLELEANPKILEDFGELKSDKWTEDILMLTNGTVLRAKGRGFQIRGFRPDMIICDDLEDEEVLYSKEQRDKLETWFFRTLLPALKPDQSLLYVGTKLHQFALIGKLAKKPQFLVRGYKALTDGKSIWEELWSTERLMALKEELGTYAFEAEYQNNPMSLEEQPIKPHFLEGVKVGGEVFATCLALDPAISEKEGSDPRAIVIMAKTDEGFREIHSESGKWGIEEQVLRILRLYEVYKPTRIVIEEIAFQKVLRNILMEKARQKGIFLPISEAFLGKGDDKKPKDKMTRLLSVAHLFEQGRVEIKSPELREELITFPDGEHDDLVDACVYALGWLNNYRAGAAFLRTEQKKFPLEIRPTLHLKEIRPGVFASVHDHPTPPRKSRILRLR